jgi:hypothetical protein
VPRWDTATVPPFVKRALTAGVEDLTTAGVARFNQETGNVSGPRYIAVAGNASRSGLFNLGTDRHQFARAVCRTAGGLFEAM